MPWTRSAELGRCGPECPNGGGSTHQGATDGVAVTSQAADSRVLLELADVLAELGCVIAVVPPEQRHTVRSTLQPLASDGTLGPVILLDSTLDVECRRAALQDALDQLLGL